ncbi:imelysin family protein [Ruegeria sp. Ofav3-42]|uniref:imelysin family protein n=1 Tax=Ruegeria sp. Ofav3-42 TaxID=2917759 RepID=UPI001EF5DD82|nr:imelysin family protein [Ruegeria sp. Ofav3-42]MCG7520912.1 imelysin family protein [Ruegeria sp. Ofav3-42]
MRISAFALAFTLPICAHAQDRGPILANTVESHILPGYAALADATGALKQAARADCDPNSAQLREAYNTAFDDWISVSHLRFGPSEAEDRAFALAFWPDSKGFTPKALSRLITDEDSAVQTSNSFAETSVAGRGFFALELMLYDPRFSDQGSAEYRCALIQAIAADIDGNARAIGTDWSDYAAVLTNPGGGSPYRSEDEAMQELYKALMTGLEFTAETRLGRPMGTFDRPRPKRAEARRSDRSLRHVELSLISLRDLAARLSAEHPEIAADLDSAFSSAIDRAQALEDPAFADVATPQGRFRVEALQQSINDIRTIGATELGPTLGISAGFNSLDGD